MCHPIRRAGKRNRKKQTPFGRGGKADFGLPGREAGESRRYCLCGYLCQRRNGVVESAADEQLTCRVKGGVLLGFGSADPCTTEAYDTGKFTTYYGRAQAVVYAPETGTIRVEAEGEHSRGEAVIEVV